MKKTIFIGAMLLFSSSAHALSTVNVANMSCSGVQTSDLTSFLSLSCTGNLSLTGGTLSSDSKIVLSATGSMTLDNLTMTAPSISLTGGNLAIGSGAIINASNSLAIYAGSGATSPFITSSAGGSISVGSTVYQIAAGSGNSLQFGTGVVSPILTTLTPGGGTVYPGGSVSIVPEPDMLSLLPVGVVTLAFLTRNRRRAGRSS